MKLKMKDIRIDGGTQPRDEICEQTVDEYAEAMQDGDQFPPVVVFHDGAWYWLADGFHRYHAARKLGFLDIEAEVHQGTKREAVLYSVGANAKHGLRRTNADKRKAVLTLLQDRIWKDWSDREIARRCAVSHDTVSRYRQSLSDSDSQPTKRKGADGRTIDTTNIGRRAENSEQINEFFDSGSEAEDREDIAEAERILADPETEFDDWEDVKGEGQKKTAIRGRGVGLRWAHEAINALKKIPAKDGLREDAFKTVISWINHNA